MTFWVVTTHAVEQLQRRYYPHWDPQKAKGHLLFLLNSSTVTSKTLLGDQVRVSGYQPEVRLVMKDKTTLVTVLPEHEEVANTQLREILNERQEEYQGELEDLERQVADIKRQREELKSEKAELEQRIKILHNLLRGPND